MALPNDMQRIVEEVARLATAGSAVYTGNVKNAARNLLRPTFVLVKPAADAMASDTTAYTAAYQIRMPRAGRILGAAIQPQAALTANASNNAVVSVQKGDGAGGAGVIMASYTSDVAGGNLAAGVTKALTLSATAANLRFPINSVLSFAITKGGTGVVVPILTISVDIEWEDIDTYPV